MKAAMLHRPRDLGVEAARDPKPEMGEVVVRIVAAGLCGTDHEIWSGGRPVASPRVMGHELVGRVESVASDVREVRPGDPVVIEPNYSCGRCPLCLEGNRNLCLSRITIGINVDGGFAELVRVPARCCRPTSAGPDRDALPPVEPPAVVVPAVNRGKPATGESAAIGGARPPGLLAPQVLRAGRAPVMVVSPPPRR